MGCTHSKNSKSKSIKLKGGNEKPLERELSDKNKNKVKHFDRTRTDESDVNEDATQKPHYSRNILNESRGTQSTQNQLEVTNTANIKKASAEVVKERVTNHPPNYHNLNQSQQRKLKSPPRKSEKFAKPTALQPTEDFYGANKEPSLPTALATTAIPLAPQASVNVTSQYYPMNEQPVQNQNQQQPPQQQHQMKKKSPEKVLKKDITMDKDPPKRHRVPDHAREKNITIAPPYRLQLTAEDMEAIRKSVQQRNERRAYMMAHRNEKDDTLYELERRMPEKDYTGQYENGKAKAY